MFEIWDKKKLSRLTFDEKDQWFDVLNNKLEEDRNLSLIDPLLKEKQKTIKEEYFKYLENCVHDDYFYKYYITKDNNKIISVCRINIKDSKYILEGLETHRDFYQKGFATKLMIEMIHSLKKEGIDTLYSEARIWNNASNNLQKKLGFEEYGQIYPNILYKLAINQWNKNQSSELSKNNDASAFLDDSTLMHQTMQLIRSVSKRSVDASQSNEPFYRLGYQSNENTFNQNKQTLGVSYPELEKISKLIIKSHAIEFLESNDFSYYELDILQTYVIGSIKDINLAIKYFKAFMPYAKEWSVVDSLCQRFKIARKYPKEVLKLLKQIASIDDEMSQRIVAVTLLSHFINDTSIDEVFEIIDKLNHPGYYSKMSKAWALATIMAKYPSTCMGYLKLNQLDKWTYNKAIQKMLESNRVSIDIKRELNLLKSNR